MDATPTPPTPPPLPPAMPWAPRPPDLVSTRLLSAEACASAALALIQHPALWECLTAVGALLDAVAANQDNPLGLARSVGEVLDAAAITDVQADEATALLTVLDATARGWARLAHGGIPPGGYGVA